MKFQLAIDGQQDCATCCATLLLAFSLCVGFFFINFFIACRKVIGAIYLQLANATVLHNKLHDFIICYYYCINYHLT